MPRYIIKLTDAQDNKDYYLEWSTVVDAPVTHGMGREQFTEYYTKRYGTEGARDLPERFDTVEKKGTSSHFEKSVDEVIWSNRAGDNETHLDLEGLLDKYCRNVTA